MKKQSFFLFISFCIISISLYGQLSYSLSNKFWRLKYAHVGGREYTFNNDNAPTLQISGASIRGNGGCNAYHTKFTIDGNSMEIGSVMSTRMACNGMQLEESLYFNALSQHQMISYEEGSNEMKFTNTSGDQLVYFAQFSRSSESYTPPPVRRSYEDENSHSTRKLHYSRPVKLSKKELARQKLLEKKLNSKRGKLSKKEQRELKRLQNKTVKQITVRHRGKGGKLSRRELRRQQLRSVRHHNVSKKSRRNEKYSKRVHKKSSVRKKNRR